LIHEKFEELIQKVTSKLSETTSLEELVSVGIAVMIDETKRQHYLFRLTHAEQTKVKSQSHRELRSRIMALRNKYICELEDVIEHHITDSTNISPKTIALTMTGATTAAMMEWMISNGSISLDTLKTEIATIIQRGIVHD